jgi:hypothetical protein
MATVLEIIRGLSQAAANASYDGYDLEQEIGLKREEGHPVLDSRVMDGFKVRFSGKNLIITYQSEMRLKELHPRNQFENEIEQKFSDIVKFLQKEYKNITKNSISLKALADADILVQSTSRIRSWVQATKQYEIPGIGEEVKPNRQTSIRDIDKSYEKQFQDFLDLSSEKRPSNDKASKNPDTPGN